jgi:hypothetical protein
MLSQDIHVFDHDSFWLRYLELPEFIIECILVILIIRLFRHLIIELLLMYATDNNIIAETILLNSYLLLHEVLQQLGLDILV